MNGRSINIEIIAGSKDHQQDPCFPLLIEHAVLYCHGETVQLSSTVCRDHDIFFPVYFA